MKVAIAKLWGWLKAHPIVLILGPVDIYVAANFFWSITQGADIGVQSALAGLGAGMVLVKIQIAGDRSRSGFVLWLIAALINGYAAVSFLVSHASHETDIPQTIEVVSAKAAMDRAQNTVDAGAQEALEAKAQNRLSLLRDTLNPQAIRDEATLKEAVTYYRQVTKDASNRPVDAIVALSRPVVLIQQGTYGAIALLIFAVLLAGWLEWVVRRNMLNGKTNSAATNARAVIGLAKKAWPEGEYPRDGEGNLLAPGIAAQILRIPTALAKDAYRKALQEETYNQS